MNVARESTLANALLIAPSETLLSVEVEHLLAEIAGGQSSRRQ